MKACICFEIHLVNKPKQNEILTNAVESYKKKTEKLHLSYK
jgi:hypothetical protein